MTYLDHPATSKVITRGEDRVYAGIGNALGAGLAMGLGTAEDRRCLAELRAQVAYLRGIVH